jgi:type II secretory pathway pseudopilin PulG
MNRKGVALILACIVVVVMIILGGATLSRSVSENTIAQNNLEAAQAFWAAEAGIQRTLYSINTDDWTGWNWDPDNPATRTINQNIGGNAFQVTATDVGTNEPKATSSGTMGAVARNIGVEFKTKIDPKFTCAAFGDVEVVMSGNGETDSYDSSLGAYGGLNVNVNGDVATNGTALGAISLSGNATVNGDVGTGPGGTIELSGNAGYTGEPSDNIDRDLDSVEIPADLNGLGSGGNYNVSGNQSSTISGGDYKYSSINVQGNGTLYIDGEVRIYVTGGSSFSITGNGKVILNEGASLELYVDGTCNIAGNGVVNDTDLPENFLLYSTYSEGGNGVQIAGNGDLIGAVYAPDCRVQVSGNGDVFGALVGDEVHIPGNGDVHYDEALLNLEDEQPEYVIKIWRDLQNPFPLSGSGS